MSLQLFSARERAHLDVLGIWAVLRNQLRTDDSFAFNKVVTRLKAMASELPEASEEDDAALVSAQVGLSLGFLRLLQYIWGFREWREYEVAGLVKGEALWESWISHYRNRK